MTHAPTYRYAVGIVGANYVTPDQMEPQSWVMTETLEDVRHALQVMRDNWAYSTADVFELGDGGTLLETPIYGYPGDGAFIYRVNREHPDFAEVVDAPGDRARHAFSYVDFESPAYLAEFGKRGGIILTKA